MDLVEEKVVLDILILALFSNDLVSFSENGLGIATVGFKLDTLFATIRTSIESTGKLNTVLEEKVTPNLAFQVIPIMQL